MDFKAYFLFRNGLCGNSIKCPVQLMQTYLGFCQNSVIYAKSNNELIIRLIFIWSVN